MKKLRFNNTYDSGKLTFIMFKEGNIYTAVCLEFDLLTQAENPKDAEERISDYAKAWLTNVKKNKLSEELLNQPAPQKYWRIYKKMLEEEQRRLNTQTDAKHSFGYIATHLIPYSQNAFSFS